MRNKTDINFVKIKSSAVHTIYIGKIGKTLTTDLTKNEKMAIKLCWVKGKESSGYVYIRKLNFYLL